MGCQSHALPDKVIKMQSLKKTTTLPSTIISFSFKKVWGDILNIQKIAIITIEWPFKTKFRFIKKTYPSFFHFHVDQGEPVSFVLRIQYSKQGPFLPVDEVQFGEKSMESGNKHSIQALAQAGTSSYNLNSL